MGEDLARTFVAFFVIIDPVGNLVVFNLMSGSTPSIDFALWRKWRRRGAVER